MRTFAKKEANGCKCHKQHLQHNVRTHKAMTKKARQQKLTEENVTNYFIRQNTLYSLVTYAMCL